MRILIPHVASITETGEVTRAVLDELIRRGLDTSSVKPCAIELHDAASQRILFLRERQVYAAAETVNGQITATSIRDFLIGSTRMSFPAVALYELNTRILHSMLVIAQKKPVLRVMTNLVDLDEMLNRIESEGRSSIVCASRDDYLAVLRYEKGRVSALCHGRFASATRESTLREEFLVGVYTQAAASPLTVSLYEDFLVSYAADARNVPAEFNGRFHDLFLSKPPVLVLRLKEREIGRWEMDRPALRIGRTPDNDIVIDNLAVSRLHAVIEESKGEHFVRDCDSLNGTEVNGERVQRCRLHDGDEITIAKHTIVFRTPGGHAVIESETTKDGFDQTMIFSRASVTPGPIPAPLPAPRQPSATPTVVDRARPSRHAAPVAVAARRTPRLVARDEFGERVIEISERGVLIGSDENADIHIDGMFVAAHHARIVVESGRVLLQKLAGLRPVKVGGRAVREIELKDNDEIQIGHESFVFHE
ncbi:MAG TPA: FHA domain-containing protein [Candidatus Krumholzibacteria bacterium]